MTKAGITIEQAKDQAMMEIANGEPQGTDEWIAVINRAMQIYSDSAVQQERERIESEHTLILVWPGFNQKGIGKIIHTSENSVVYMNDLFPENTQWNSAENPPQGEKPNRMVLIRRSSGEMLFGRFAQEWIVYFPDAKGLQLSSELYELKHDKVIEWMELPKSVQ